MFFVCILGSSNGCGENGGKLAHAIRRFPFYCSEGRISGTRPCVSTFGGKRFGPSARKFGNIRSAVSITESLSFASLHNWPAFLAIAAAAFRYSRHTASMNFLRWVRISASRSAAIELSTFPTYQMIVAHCSVVEAHLILSFPIVEQSGITASWKCDVGEVSHGSVVTGGEITLAQQSQMFVVTLYFPIPTKEVEQQIESQILHAFLIVLGHRFDQVHLYRSPVR